MENSMIEDDRDWGPWDDEEEDDGRFDYSADDLSLFLTDPVAPC